MSGTAGALPLGYFGKLPGSGDFVSRGLPRALIARLDAWLHDGMADLPASVGADWLDYYLVAPAWSFLLPAGTWDEGILLGALIPSVDRVGRYFPLAAVRAVAADTPAGACLPPASDWHAASRALLLRALRETQTPDELMAGLASLGSGTGDMASADGDIFSILGAETNAAAPSGEASAHADFNWPELPILFEARADRGFWWSQATPAQPVRRMVHRGPPDTPLFGALFGPPNVGGTGFETHSTRIR